MWKVNAVRWGWKIIPYSIVLVFPGGTSQANQPKMNETVNHKMVRFFSPRTVPSIWNFGSCNIQFNSLNVILEETMSLSFDSAQV